MKTNRSCRDNYRISENPDIYVDATGVKNDRDVVALFTKFHNERASYYFPRFEEDQNIFEGLKVYWKEPKDEDEV